MFQREGSTSNETGETDPACDLDNGVPWACVQPRVIVRDSNHELYVDTDSDGYTDQRISIEMETDTTLEQVGKDY